MSNFSVPIHDQVTYVAQMERVKLRIDEADTLLREGKDERCMIYAAAQLRLAVEEVAFSSLVGNRQAMEEAERSIRVKDWGAVCKGLRAVNPDYWPRGIRQVKTGEVIQWVDVQGGLEETDSPRVWGRLSSLLHARNPWLPAINLGEEREFLVSVISGLRLTLNEHLLSLVGDREKLCCQVGADPVRVYAFGLVDDEDE